MKIIKLHVENFGKLSNFDCIFNDNFTQFIEDNGWGKTTLSSFIKAMFYGLEANGRKKEFESQRSKYLPWQGGNYGGNLTFNIKNKTYTIYRYFGKTPELDTFQLFDEDLKKVSDDFSKSIGEELFGVGEETFLISSYFGQSKLDINLTDQAVSSLAGLEKFKNDAENVDIALNIIEKKRKEIVSITPKQIQLKEIQNSIASNESLLELKENKAKDFKDKLQKLTDERKRLLQVSKAEDEQRKTQIKLLNEKTILQEKLNQKNNELNLILSNSVLDRKKSNSNFKYFLSSLLILVSIVFAIFGFMKLINIIFDFTLSVFCLIGGICCMLFFRKKDDVSTKVKQDDLQILKSEIQSIKQSIELLPELNIKIFEKNNQLQREVENEFIALQTSYNEILSEIDLIKDELSILLENKKNTEEAVNLNEQKINLLKLASKFLETARENVSLRFVKPLNSKFKSLFEKFNIQNEIALNTKLDAQIITSKGAKNVGFLSKGSQDLVAICQRFSMLEDIYKKEKPFLILDDSFVNIDDSNMNVAKKIISFLSNNYQVIYFTCSKSRKM